MPAELLWEFEPPLPGPRRRKTILCLISVWESAWRTEEQSLERLGHNVKERSSLGLVEAVAVQKSKVAGAADPRQEEPALAERR